MPSAKELQRRAEKMRKAYADALAPMIPTDAPPANASAGDTATTDSPATETSATDTPPGEVTDTESTSPEKPPSAAEVKAAAKEAAAKWTKSLGNRAMLAWLLVGVAAWAGTAIAGVDVPDQQALVLALAVVTACLALIWIWQYDNGGFLSPLRGADGRLSTSYTQAGLWTLLLAFAFALFAARLAFGTLEVAAFEQAGANFVPTYLLLLGGPFAAAALTGLNYGVRKDDGSIQKTAAFGAQLRDVIADDSGRANLNDSQFLVFNVIGAATFLVLLARNAATLPVLPSTLVGLTSLSALAYVTTKAVSNQRPVISSIVAATMGGVGTEQPITTGTLVDVRGNNFVVPGATQAEDMAQVRVRFGTVEVGVEGKRPDGTPNPVASSVFVKVPSLPEGTTRVDVKVITAAGVESEAYPLSLGVIRNGG